MITAIRRSSSPFAGLLLLMLITGQSWAGDARLLMFEEDFCPYCAQWKRDVGVIYHKTPQGKRFPLQTLDIDDERPEYAALTDIRYTPTFVVWHNNREIGRITGYPGEDFFWGLLDKILEKAQTGNKL